MRVNRKTNLLFLFLGFFLIFAGYYFKDVYWHYVSGIPQIEKPVENFFNNVEKVTKEVFAPPPLIVEKKEANAADYLSRDEVFKWTNYFRIENRLSPLSENTQLNFAAQEKARHMIKNGYFAHFSPGGLGVDYWVEDAGYAYLAVGENLALGDFEDDEALVQAWMDSPGHRENILNTGFKEIGTAVLKGQYEGRETWFAVQVFGIPFSECPQPSMLLSNKIEKYKQEIDSLRVSINLLRIQIDNKNLRHQAKKQDFVLLVNEYNELVNQYNSSVDELEEMIVEYNMQVHGFNNCVSSL